MLPVALVLGSINTHPAQAYPIDCAILLCLAGGFPASAECSAAKAEFIRRITPFPIEPPLQVWRCPLSISYRKSSPYSFEELHDVGFDEPTQFPMTISDISFDPAGTISQILEGFESEEPDHHSEDVVKPNLDTELPFTPDHHFVQQTADVDISGADFDFVRSIQVWNVESSSRIQGRDDDECNSYDRSRLGTYDQQGAFSWSQTNMFSTPDAFVKPIPTGSCQNYFLRAVFVEWRDSEGSYGWERVDY